MDVEGFEGPLDLLLMLARQQKVDLAKISILALADQYLTFIEEARKLRLELAADYLVMAAWLAYLKSRLLLPDAQHRRSERGRHGDRAGATAEAAGSYPRMSPNDCSNARSSIAMCSTAATPSRLPRSSVRNGRRRSTTCSRPMRSSARSNALAHVRFAKRTVWSLADARDALERLIGQAHDWAGSTNISSAIWWIRRCGLRSLASSFASALELVREGVLEVISRGLRADLRAQVYGSGDRGG